jgi:RNA polymerase sigma factor (sigma-70 family)
MAAHDSKGERLPTHRDRFATTHWSLVVSAAGHRDGHSPEASRALATLCENYWFPLYAFVRHAGYSAEDSQDLTQEFFARLLARSFFASADRQKGKFRSFLLGALKHFLADEWDRAHAQKRGGTQTVISFDSLDAETRYRLEPALDLTPEKMFEKQWALSLLEQVLSRLHAEMAADGKSVLFEALKDTLAGVRSTSYAAIGAELGMTEGAVKVAAHRMRRRYRDLLREEIAQTVANPNEIGDEIRYLLSCL